MSRYKNLFGLLVLSVGVCGIRRRHRRDVARLHPVVSIGDAIGAQHLALKTSGERGF